MALRMALSMSSREFEKDYMPPPMIKKKIDNFFETNKIPHIIFYGISGTGKKTIVNYLITRVYDGDRQKIKNNVMYVNCSHGKGIKFIREELKFFAKTNLQTNIAFKSIVLLNADSLTNDAQSALRRCIELFSHNTRFFIIVENKEKLLNPILSRFCEIYIPEYMVDGNIVNLHQFHLDAKFRIMDEVEDRRNRIASIMRQYIPELISQLQKQNNERKNVNAMNIMMATTELYNAGFSTLDLLDYISVCGAYNQEQLAKVMIRYEQIKSEYRFEKLLMATILFYIARNL